MAKRNIKKSILTPALPSKNSELTAPDGEIASFSNIEWLLPQDNVDDSDSPNPGASSSSSSSKIPTILNPSLSPQGLQLPPGSRLLAIHSLLTHPARRFLLFIDNERQLNIMMDDPEITISIEAWPESKCGNIRRVLPFKNMVTLIGDKGMAYILIDENAEKATLFTSLPQPPNPTFAMQAAHLPGYTPAKGFLPKITITLPCTSSDNLSNINLSDWLDNGDESAVSPSLSSRVMSAVGKEIKEYVDAANRAGFFLFPTIVTAALSENLFSRPEFLRPVDSSIEAIVNKWEWHDMTLSLTLELNLPPRSIAMSWSPTPSTKDWAPIFPTLNVYSSTKSHFYNYDFTPSSISSRKNEEGNRQGIFIFDSITMEAMESDLRSANSFRKTGGASLSGDEPLRLILVSADAYAAKEGDSPCFTPVAGAQSLRPRDGILCDNAIILFGGEWETLNNDGDVITESLENALIVSDNSTGLFFCRKSAIADTPLSALTIAPTTRSSSDPQLYSFHDDAIRLLSVDKKGLYYPSKIFSGNPGSHNILPIATSDGIVYLSSRGLNLLKSSGIKQSIPLKATDSLNPLCHHSKMDPLPLLYDHSTGIVILPSDNSCLIFDMENEELFSSEFIVRDAVQADGVIYATNSNGELCRLIFNRIPLSVGEDDENIVVEENEKIKSTEPTNVKDSDQQSYGNLTTRAIKLGDPLMRKRILSVEVTSPLTKILLEGSDDLLQWSVIVDWSFNLRSIHAPAYRYHRLRLKLPSNYTHLLRQIVIGYEV